jgi:hypothetical protein
MRTLITFLFLLIILLCTLYLSSIKENLKEKDLKKKVRFDPISYEALKPEIEKYRIGTPSFQYDNPNFPYSNPYKKHPLSSLLDSKYRQPIDGIVPDNYPYTLQPNEMIPPEIDMTYYFSDLLS